jgi:plastocyanin
VTYGNYLKQGAIALALAAMLAACGDDNGPTGPSGGGAVVGSGNGVGASGATITIGTNGAVSPGQVTISVGQSVTFVNSHTGGHEIASDPHPAHTNCPSINALGTIASGQTKLTNSFAGAGTCRFHDHGDPGNANVMGTIVIQ